MGARLDSGEVKVLKPENIATGRIRTLTEDSNGKRDVRTLKPEHMVSSRVIPFVPPAALASSIEDLRNLDRTVSAESPRRHISRASRASELVAAAAASAKVPVAHAWQATESGLGYRIIQQPDAGDAYRDTMSPHGKTVAAPSMSSSQGRTTIRGLVNTCSGSMPSARESPAPSSRMKSPRGVRPPSPPPAHPAMSPAAARHAATSPAASKRTMPGSNFNSLAAPTPPMVAQSLSSSGMPPWGSAPFSMEALRNAIEARASQPRHIGGQGTPARTISTAGTTAATPAHHTPGAGVQLIGMVPPPLRPSIQYT